MTSIRVQNEIFKHISANIDTIELCKIIDLICSEFSCQDYVCKSMLDLIKLDKSYNLKTAPKLYNGNIWDEYQDSIVTELLDIFDTWYYENSKYDFGNDLQVLDSTLFEILNNYFMED